MGETWDVTRGGNPTINRGGGNRRIWGTGNRRSYTSMSTTKIKGYPRVELLKYHKKNNNLIYYYFCGYDGDNNIWQFHPNNRKGAHTPNVSQGEANQISGASMKSQHKTLPNGSGGYKGKGS